MTVDPTELSALSAKLRTGSAPLWPVEFRSRADQRAYVERWSDRLKEPIELTPIAIEKLDELLKDFAPAPSQPRPDLDQVVMQIQPLATSNVAAAVDLLTPLTWDERWKVLHRLGETAPDPQTGSYLQRLSVAAAAHPNLDQRIVGAIAAERLIHDDRTINEDNIDAFKQLGSALLDMAEDELLEVFAHLGLDTLAAEGAIATMFALAELGGLPAEGSDLAAAPTPRSDPPFGDWTKPKNMPFWFYIGNAAHTAIAAAYLAQHPVPVHLVTLNISPIGTIVRALEAAYDFKAGHIKRALSRSKPDIFDFSLEHGVPPGWVYEIKPSRLVKVAEYEVAFYATALTLANVPVIPGPRGFAGTLPAPHGWFVYTTPLPGVIVYDYRRATRQQIEARKQVPIEGSAINVEAAAKALGVTLAAAAVYVAVGAFLAAGGWILAFG